MKRLVDLSLYLVTNRKSLELEDVFNIIQASIDGGVRIFQLISISDHTNELVYYNNGQKIQVGYVNYNRTCNEKSAAL